MRLNVWNQVRIGDVDVEWCTANRIRKRQWKVPVTLRPSVLPGEALEPGEVVHVGDDCLWRAVSSRSRVDDDRSVVFLKR